MRFASFDQLGEYAPAGHEGVVNRLLVGRENWGVAEVSVWHGRLDPGAHAEHHQHPHSLQIYVGLTGELTVGGESEERPLGPLDTVMFDAGETHFVENRSAGPAELLVISTPALR